VQSPDRQNPEGIAMNGYLISATDRRGLAAQLFEAAARRGVNVSPAFGLADGTTGLICVGSEDEAGLQAAIADAGLSATPFEMIVTELQDKPGTGAALFRKLADAGVDLRIAVPIGMSGDNIQFALGATDTARLRAAIGG
jgi:hypothetical protein